MFLHSIAQTVDDTGSSAEAISERRGKSDILSGGEDKILAVDVVVGRQFLLDRRQPTQRLRFFRKRLRAWHVHFFGQVLQCIMGGAAGARVDAPCLALGSGENLRFGAVHARQFYFQRQRQNRLAHQSQLPVEHHALSAGGAAGSRGVDADAAMCPERHFHFLRQALQENKSCFFPDSSARFVSLGDQSVAAGGLSQASFLERSHFHKRQPAASSHQFDGGFQINAFNLRRAGGHNDERALGQCQRIKLVGEAAKLFGTAFDTNPGIDGSGGRGGGQRLHGGKSGGVVEQFDIDHTKGAGACSGDRDGGIRKGLLAVRRLDSDDTETRHLKSHQRQCNPLPLKTACAMNSQNPQHRTSSGVIEYINSNRRNH